MLCYHNITENGNRFLVILAGAYSTAVYNDNVIVQYESFDNGVVKIYINKKEDFSENELDVLQYELPQCIKNVTNEFLDDIRYHNISNEFLIGSCRYWVYVNHFDE